MIVQPQIITRKGSADMFTGDVFIDTAIYTVEPSHVRVNAVHFTPGARTAWHSHAVGRYLYVAEGIALVQERGEEIKTLKAGDTIYTPPNVWHWHGAAKNNFMTLLAIWEAPESGKDESSCLCCYITNN